MLLGCLFLTRLLAPWIILPASEVAAVTWAAYPAEHLAIFNGVQALARSQGSLGQVI